MSKIQSAAKEINRRTETLNEKLKSFQKELSVLNQSIASAEGNIASQKAQVLEQKRLEEAIAREKVFEAERATQKAAKEAEDKKIDSNKAEATKADAVIIQEKKVEQEAKAVEVPQQPVEPPKHNEEKFDGFKRVSDEKKAEQVIEKPINTAEENKTESKPNEVSASQTDPVQGQTPRPPQQGQQRPYNNQQGQQRPYNNNNQGTGQPRPYNNNNQGTGQPRPYNNQQGQPPRPYNNNNQGTDQPRTFNNQQGADQPRTYNNNQQGTDQPRTYNNNQQGQPPRPYNNNNAGTGAPRPYNNNAGTGAPRPYNNNAGTGAPRPYNNNAGGTPRPYNNAGTGAPRPYNNNQGGDRPFNRNAGGPRKPTSPLADLTPAAEKEKVSNYDPNKKLYRDKPEDKKAPIKKTPGKNGFVSVSADEDARMRGPRKKPKFVARPEPIKIEHAIITAENITIKDLAEKIGKPAAQIIKKLFFLGIMATINHEIDLDTAILIAAEYNITLEQKLEKTFEEVLDESDTAANIDDNQIERPPVVTIMGHVDHGKTSLLDAIRYTNVTAHEAGGITQHIGAYMIKVKDRKITFIDTPGHEAFTAMRARGAQVTDVAIIVVAADDGIMPQTVEAINHVKAAKVPIIVAINKMDKPGANPEKVKQELTEHGLVAEDWGGDTVIVPVSAVTKEGIDNLLEMILLVAEVTQLKADPSRKAKGTIVEAKLDKGRGPVATVLIQNGTLRVGDTIVAGTAYGRVRAMLDDLGNKVAEATPSMPVEVLGFNDVPDAGDVMHAVDDEKLSRQVSDERKDKLKSQQQKAKAKASLDDLFSQIKDGEVKELNVIVKADVQGSVEAVKQAIEKLSNDKVRVCAIHGGVGAITETDIMFASTSNAIIIGFNVRPESTARAIADREKVDIRLYRVIYSAIEDIQKAMKGMLAPVFAEIVIGHAAVRATFKVSDIGTIAGSMVTDGKITRNSKVRLFRDNVVVFEGDISSLKRIKDDVKEVASGFECGICLNGYNDIREADIIEAYVIEQVKD